MSDDDAVHEFEAWLHAQGWSERVTVERELKTWRELANELNAYRLEVEDYTNDLYAREALELALQRLPEPARSTLAAQVGAADDQFRAASVPDVRALLGRHFKVDGKDGWWWHRIPRSGPLAELLRSG